MPIAGALAVSLTDLCRSATDTYVERAERRIRPRRDAVTLASPLVSGCRQRLSIGSARRGSCPKARASTSERTRGEELRRPQWLGLPGDRRPVACAEPDRRAPRRNDPIGEGDVSHRGHREHRDPDLETGDRPSTDGSSRHRLAVLLPAGEHPWAMGRSEAFWQDTRCASRPARSRRAPHLSSPASCPSPSSRPPLCPLWLQPRCFVAKRRSSSVKVEPTRHKDTRTTIPTGELQDVVRHATSSADRPATRAGCRAS